MNHYPQKTGRYDSAILRVLAESGRSLSVKDICTRLPLTTNQVSPALSKMMLYQDVPGLVRSEHNGVFRYAYSNGNGSKPETDHPQLAIDDEPDTGTMYEATGVTHHGYPCVVSENGTNGLCLIGEGTLDELVNARALVTKITALVEESK